MNYFELPLIDVTDSFTEAKKNQHYKTLSHNFSQEQISKVRDFHRGNFSLSGTTHFLPEFLVSNNARQHLIYPQGFLIMEAGADYYTDRSDVDSFELRFTLDGEGYLEYGNKSYILRKGEGYFIDCRKHHFYKTNGDQWISTIFHFNGQLVENIYSQYASDANVKFSAANCPNFEMLQFQLLKTSLKIVPYSEYRISCLFDILLTELLSSKERNMLPNNSYSAIQEIISFLRSNYAQNITFQAISHQFGISRSHFSREFKKFTGFTPKEYLTQIRISQAKFLLKGSPLSIEEISAAVGFQDTAHFIQIFRSNEGTTPLKYRKS